MKLNWLTSYSLIPYPDALAQMEKCVTAILDGTGPETIWLLEHPPLYTKGTGAKIEDLLDQQRFPIFEAGRGGQFTYHGPGQRIGYIMLDLRQRGRDVRQFVHNLEEMLILALAEFGVTAVRRTDRVGVWIIHQDGREEKIAAIGVRLRRWVSFHGFSLNISPDLTHYQGIVPCGIPDHGVTSLQALGIGVTMAEVDACLKTAFLRVFGSKQA